MKIRNRPLLFLSLAIALSDFAVVVSSHYFAKRALHETLVDEGQRIESSYEMLISQVYVNMLTMATFISLDPEISSLMLAGKQAVEAEGGGPGGAKAAIIRQQLLDKIGPSWREVQGSYHVRQLHFHLGPASTSFLRVHRPEKFGDTMHDLRFTVIDTNAERNPRTGFETGRVYSGLRGVVPVSALDPETGKTVHAGALEVGTSFDTLLTILDQRYDFGAAALLTKEHVESTMWPEAIKKVFGQSQSACGCMLEAASRDGLEEILSAAQSSAIYLQTKGAEFIEVGDHTFAISHFPLRDYKGTKDLARPPVGALVFWRNADAQIAAYDMSQQITIGYGIVGFIVIEILLIVAFRYASRKLANEVTAKTRALSDSETRFRRLFENAPIPYQSLDAQGRILDVNNAWSSLTGLPHEQVIGQKFKDVLTAESRATYDQTFERFLAEGSMHGVELALQRAYGPPLLGSFEGRVSYDEQGQFKQTYCLFTDITEKRQAEKQMAEKTAELERSNAEFQQFASALSHDLREPLRMVSSFLKLFQRKFGGDVPAEGLEYLTFAANGAERMSRMITSLLDYARVHTRALTPTPVDSRAALEEALMNLRAVIENDPAKITIPPEMPRILGDHDLLVRVFQNLIGNALKYRSPDRPAEIALTVTRQERNWLFALEDNGIGIEPQDQERVFGLFQRLHHPDTHEGSGVGLALVKRIITRNGGRIWIESNRNNGCKFLFTFPIL
ncbi:hypothetical protein JCM17960_29300 [Magnetospira thiophila]